MKGITDRIGMSILLCMPAWAGQTSWAGDTEGFEVPALSGNQFQYQPAGGPWTLQGGAGLSRNGSGFTNGNPPAPEGQQVLFLQGPGSRAEQTLNFGPGEFRLRVMAAQRGNTNDQQTVRLAVDGVEIVQLTPTGATYEETISATFSVTGGAHLVRLEGLNPLGGDNTAFLDDLRIEEIRSNPPDLEPVTEFDLTARPAGPSYPEGSVLLRWWASANAPYLLERGLDLHEWSPLGPFAGAPQSAYLTVVDEEVAGQERAFWRLGVPAPSFTPEITAMSQYGRPYRSHPQGGFEDDSISGFQYNPVTPAWSMNGGAGIAQNGSELTSLNPDAPEGNYVAFLQNESSVSGLIQLPAEGLYRLRFYTAQRQQGSSTDRQRLRITVGDMEVAELTPAGSAYQELTTRPFRFPGGPRTIAIEGLGVEGGSATAFIDDLRVEILASWNDPLTWLEGSVPDVDDHIFIPPGSAVCLEGACRAATVRVGGELLTAPVDTTLASRWVMVSGVGARLEVGTHGSPFEQRFTLTLEGPNTGENLMGAGTKFLMAMDQGTVDLHGLPQVSWTTLDATAEPGDDTIMLSEPVAWRSGDHVVIAPSGLDPNQAEVRTIASRPDDRSLVLSAGVNHRHFGGAPQTYLRPSDGRSWVLDQRAEVGLLTHNVKVQGDSQSEIAGFGGHLMIMKAAGQNTAGFGRLSNVELYRMGQKSILARYPMHWHMQGDNGAGQFIEDSSIHRSFNRAITIHGTESARVERNVAYDHLGHGIFLEDGSERFNKINHNLALLTKRPAPGEEVIPTDNSDDEEQNRTPATFWITNPNNEFIGNVAAGTIGTGFWFALHREPTGLSASDPRFAGMQPIAEPLGAFVGNTAHSCMSALDINDQVNSDLTLRKNGEWANDGPFFLDDFTQYSNRTGLYAGIGGERENVIYRNNVMADNLQHSFIATYHTLQDSLLVADSGNGLLPPAATRSAILLYDGAVRTVGCHLVGFDAPNASLIQTIGAATKHPNTLLDGLSYDHEGPPRAVLPDFNLANPDYAQVNSPADPRVWGSVLRDVDGSTTGTAGHSLIGNHSFMHTGGEVQPPNWTRVFHTPNRFAHLRLSYGLSPSEIPDTTWTRMKTEMPDQSYFYGFKVDPHQQVPVIVSNGFTYSIDFASLPSSSRIDVAFDDATAGDEVIVRLAGIGSRAPLITGGMALQLLLSDLQDADEDSYHIDLNGDLWLKFVATGKRKNVTIRWL